MALINYPKREIIYKIVYYGTGLGGKTTNLKYIYDHLEPQDRGELVQLRTETERTLFFDYLPIELTSVHGFKTRFALYTVPGQWEYNESRRMILKGADGIIFVADSNATRSRENIDAVQNMIDNLAEHKLKIESMPLVLQYNKRDLLDAMPIGRLERELNPWGVPSFEAVALEGKSVFATLKALAKLVVNQAPKL
ncbi:MAG TPA: GTPase domain-containing protein [Candidatus Obscuribacterales bacterium]